MVDLYSQHQKILPEINQKVAECIAKSRFIGGEEVEQFSSRLSKLLKVKYVTSCGNGTDAIQLALMALQLPKDSEVIVPNFTFAAPAESVALLGLKPIFADVCAETYNMTVESVREKISSLTKAIIVVHLFGLCADMIGIMDLARQHDLVVIEDVAQSLGATCIGAIGEKHFAGTIGHIGTTSFFPTKNLGAMGDGGAVFTQDAMWGTRLKMLANHGATEKYRHEMVGINSRLDTLQAAILNIKIAHFENYLSARKTAGELYFDHLKQAEHIKLPALNKFTPHTFNQFVVRVPNREALKKYLLEAGIPTMVYYPTPLHIQNAFLKYNPQCAYPVTEMLCDEVLALPMHTELDEEQIAFICKNVLLGLEKSS